MDYVKKGRLPDIEELEGNAVNIHNIFSDYLQLDDDLKPIVFVTHMEHHSNQTTWLETIATVKIIRSDEQGNVDLEYFRQLLEKYKDKKNKIAAITGSSNSKGIHTPYHDCLQRTGKNYLCIHSEINTEGSSQFLTGTAFHNAGMEYSSLNDWKKWLKSFENSYEQVS